MISYHTWIIEEKQDKLSQRYTAYKCEVCRSFFKHYAKKFVDPVLAMNVSGVSIFCVTRTNVMRI